MEVNYKKQNDKLITNINIEVQVNKFCRQITYW